MTQFVSLDFETATGARDSACQIGLVKVVDGVVVDQFVSFIRPPGDALIVAPMNEHVHGISAAQLADAPTFADLWPAIEEFIGSLPIVAHSSDFDISVLRATLQAHNLPLPQNQYFCTVILSRTDAPLNSHRLPLVTEYYGIELAHHHDALADARACAEVALRVLANQGFESLAEIWKTIGQKETRVSDRAYAPRKRLGRALSINIEDEWDLVPSDANDFEEGIWASSDIQSLDALRVAVTGELPVSRSDAERLIKDAGGVYHPKVQRKTDVLVLGYQDPSKLGSGKSKSNQVELALELQAEGKPLLLMKQEQFMRLVTG